VNPYFTGFQRSLRFSDTIWRLRRLTLRSASGSLLYAEKLGLSQKALAKRLGIDEATVRRSEREGICKLGLRVQRILERWVDGCD